MCGYVFEVFLDNQNEYRFNLRAPNNEIVCQSEGYTQKHNAINTIERIKQCAADATIKDET
ncbi:MAG: DUF1508 domain-containing protein [Magnetococcales bacterium]|nr:DUF1508 domain-containing protein [Magnetococcales bacterium]